MENRLTKTIYEASYFTEAEISRQPDLSLAEATTVRGDTLVSVRDRAAKLNFVSNEECYQLTELVFKEEWQEYVPVAHFDCFNLERTE
tara:strand:+ start:200 stop:463 length:264 start_codon:yes stop_codon:yes gene_type:complete